MEKNAKFFTVKFVLKNVSNLSCHAITNSKRGADQVTRLQCALYRQTAVNDQF